jgi:hypothetical protein
VRKTAWIELCFKRVYAPTKMFSTTVMPPNSRMFWKVLAMCRAVIFSGGWPSMR